MKRKMSYSQSRLSPLNGGYWGEFYDTVSTCDEYTDEQKNQFAIFEALDKCTTAKEVRKVLRVYKLSETEINRLNSPCLDGLLVSAKYKKPLQKIIKSYPKYLETCRYYLEKGISKRCLDMASKYGREKIVEILLDKGADINNDRALRWASGNGHTETVKLLLDRSSINCVNRVWILCLASLNGHTDTVKLLLDKGADIHADNDLALRSASEKGRTDTVKLLLDRGADIHAGNDMALSLAACGGYTETVRLILDRGADIHANGDRALACAITFDHAETVQFLLDRGAIHP